MCRIDPITAWYRTGAIQSLRPEAARGSAMTTWTSGASRSVSGNLARGQGIRITDRAANRPDAQVRPEG